MKCNVLFHTLGMGLKQKDIIEQDINAWLARNPNVKIIQVTQAGLGTSTIVTTIIFE